MIDDPTYTAQLEEPQVEEVRTIAWSEVVIALSLFAIGILSRLPFTGSVLYHWDSINFAFSLERFDVAAAQPHVPGYILYVYLGRLFDTILGSAQETFAAISVVSSGLAAAALYLLGRDMFGRKVGLAASLFLLSSPLFWFYGEIALPHTLDTFAVLLAVWLLYRLIQGEGWFSGTAAAAAAAAWLGIAGGLRPQTQVFLLPLALYTAWRIGWRRSLVALLVLVLVDLAWFVPLVFLNGGVPGYFSIMSSFSESFNSTTSLLSGGGLWGLARNLRKLGMYTLYGWGAALVPFGLAVVVFVYRLVVSMGRSRQDLNAGAAALLSDTRTCVLFLWIAPTLAYYTIIHMGQQGLVFVFLPALLLLSAAGLYAVVKLPAVFTHVILTGLVAVNALVFLAAPTYPFGDRLKILTLDTLRTHDQRHLALLEGIQGNFDQQHSLILASWWRFPQYYLPEYALVPFHVGARWEVDEGQGAITDEAVDLASSLGIQPDEHGFLSIDPAALGLVPDESGHYYLVLFDSHLSNFNLAADRQERLEIPGEGWLSFVRLNTKEAFYLGDGVFDVIPLDR